MSETNIQTAFENNQLRLGDVSFWIDDCRQWLEPADIIWVDGSKAQSSFLYDLLCSEEKLIRLNRDKYPNSYFARSDPDDVARVEDRTFICSKSEQDAGPTNIWREPAEMKKELNKIMSGCMKGRTLYVIPYLMGPVNSKYSRVGFELTDSVYVVLNMSIMAKVGQVALDHLDRYGGNFVKGIHSYGTLDPQRRYICHFPETKEIISFNSDYGGNALQGKKCFSLRIASSMARNEGWLAEHMLILGIEDPNGRKVYIAAAFPSACGKTNLAMLVPPDNYIKAGWKITTLGDDIAWLNVGTDGRLYAINPENGFFGVAPGTSTKSNPNAMAAIKSNTIFTNTALNLENFTPWWEGMGETPNHIMDWHGKEWHPGNSKAAHPNSRFTTPISQCPSLDPNWNSPFGVPISAIIFGGRRCSVMPLVMESFDWAHGIYLGAVMASETTAAAVGSVGKLKRDPMAMRPFIGYHVGDYLNHWLSFADKPNIKLPNIFTVNWFRKDNNGEYLWPGFRDNMRVLEWIFRRIHKDCSANDRGIAKLPKIEDININGMGTAARLAELLDVSEEEWKVEFQQQVSFLKSLGDKVPEELFSQLEGCEFHFN